MPFYLEMSQNINSTTRYSKFGYISIYKSSTDSIYSYILNVISTLLNSLFSFIFFNTFLH